MYVPRREKLKELDTNIISQKNCIGEDFKWEEVFFLLKVGNFWQKSDFKVCQFRK